MLRKTVLGTLAAGTGTGVVLFVTQIVRQFSVTDWLRSGQPTMPAIAAAFAVILIAVGGADLVRFFVKAATRS